jgi:hypothetical protein
MEHENKCLQDMNDELLRENKTLKYKLEDAEAQIGSIRSVVANNIHIQPPISEENLHDDHHKNFNPSESTQYHKKRDTASNDTSLDKVSLQTRAYTLEDLYERTQEVKHTAKVYKSPSKSIITETPGVLTDKVWIQPRKNPYPRPETYKTHESSFSSSTADDVQRHLSNNNHDTEYLEHYSDWKSRESVYQAQIHEKQRELDALKSLLKR